MCTGCSRSAGIRIIGKRETSRNFGPCTLPISCCSDPEKRAQFDIRHETERQTRWRIVSAAPHSADNFEMERVIRLTVLEILYMQRLTESNAPGVFLLDLEQLLGAAREHVEFTLWYLQQKQLVQRTENSRLAITAAGVDYLEAECKDNGHQRRLPSAGTAAA